MIRALVEAQADLQVALGWHRLSMRQICRATEYNDAKATEDRMVRSLARLHALLTEYGHQMMHPAIHPDVPHNHDPKALKP